jgi:hypothetical protein
MQFRFCISNDQPLFENESRQYASGESASAETEQINLRTIFVVVVAANEFIRVKNVAFQALTESASKYRQRHKRRGPDAIIVFRSLGISPKV